MADSVNRIVPSSVALDRVSWRGKGRQRKRENNNRTGSLPSDEPVAPAVTGAAEPELNDPHTDKGKNLDVSV
ncbi:MAG: hypothetical protein ACREQV_27420 [Candidatus Binatia bacterium]